MKRFFWVFALGLIFWAVSLPSWALSYRYGLSSGGNCGAWPCVPYPTGYWFPTGVSPCGNYGMQQGYGVFSLTNCPPTTSGAYAVSRVTQCSGSLIAPDNSGSGTCVSTCPSGQEKVTITQSPGGVSIAASEFCSAVCPAGQTRNANGACVVPPCPTGSTGTYSFTGISLPSSGCLSGCNYSTSGVAVGIRVDGVMKWVAGATSTGESCTGGDTMSAALPVTPTPDNCVVDSQGRTVCPGATSDCVNVDGHEVCGPDGIDGKDCQMVNGKVVCANATLDDAPTNCIIAADGKMRCIGDTTGVDTQVTSSTDPVTGNTTRTSVTTSGLAGSGTKTTITVYDSGGNVISSSTTLTGGFDPGSSGTGGTGGAPDGAIEGTGEGEGEGEEQSVAAVFAGPSEGEPRAGLSWGRTGEEVKAELSARWNAAPVVAAVKGFSNVSLSGSGGTCPNFCLPLFGDTVCSEVHCDLWDAAAPVLGVVLLAVGVFLAIRIVLSA